MSRTRKPSAPHFGRGAVQTTVSKAPRRKARPAAAVTPCCRVIQPPARSGIVVARAPKRGVKTVGGVTLSHADRQLWPGITKLRARRILAGRRARRRCPASRTGRSAIVRCPEGIGGERFFQKRDRRPVPAAGARRRGRGLALSWRWTMRTG